MNVLREHNYYVAPHPIKSEIVDKSALEAQELNIKMECESHSDNEELQPNEETNTDEEINTESDAELPEVDVSCGNNSKTDTDSDSERSGSSNSGLSELKKAYILQSCMSLFDSSSSDDDELILLWLLSKKRKKQLKRRHRF